MFDLINIVHVVRFPIAFIESSPSSSGRKLRREEKWLFEREKNGMEHWSLEAFLYRKDNLIAGSGMLFVR